MVVTTLAGVFGVPVDHVDSGIDTLSVIVRDYDVRRRKTGDLSILEIDHPIGVFDEGRNVTREIGGVRSEADDQRD